MAETIDHPRGGFYLATLRHPRFDATSFASTSRINQREVDRAAGTPTARDPVDPVVDPRRPGRMTIQVEDIVARRDLAFDMTGAIYPRPSGSHRIAIEGTAIGLILRADDIFNNFLVAGAGARVPLFPIEQRRVSWRRSDGTPHRAADLPLAQRRIPQAPLAGDWGGPEGIEVISRVARTIKPFAHRIGVHACGSLDAQHRIAKL